MAANTGAQPADEWFATGLRHAREAAGLTVTALAEAAGTSRAAINAYETGARDPRLQTAVRLALACGYRLTITSAADSHHSE